MRKDWVAIGGAIILASVLATMPGAAVAGPTEDSIAAAKRNVEEGRCDEAYQGLASVEGLESRARLLAAQCRIRKGLYSEALEDLEVAQRAGDLTQQQVGDVDLYRGVALYHLERYPEAAASIDQANGRTSQDAEFALYRGLIALRDGDNDRAAPALESAARLAPELTEPVASYYAGLAWQGVSERQKARDAFQRVIDLDGDGPWGLEAAKLLESTELFPYFVRGSVGVEYDSNVVLRGENVTQDAEQNELSTAGENSWRGAWSIDGGVQLFAKGDWSGGMTASYYGNAHADVQDLNTHYPTIGAYVARRLGPNTTFQSRYQFGHAWVDEDAYLTTQLLEASIAHTWEKAGTTFFITDVLGNDLHFTPFDVPDEDPGAPDPPGPCDNPNGGCSPEGVDEERERDRDGVGFSLAVDHRYLVPISKQVEDIFEQVEVGGGYRFRYYDSEGKEWEYMGHLFSAGLEAEFPHDISLAALFRYEFRDFQHPSTFPDSEIIGVTYMLSNSDREEHEILVEAEIEKDITDNFSVSTRYSYMNNESNRAVYDFDRHIVGGYFNFRFD